MTQGLPRLDARHAVVAGAALVPAAVGCVLFGATFVDDVHITLWVADSLAEQGEMLSYNGERLEQSSSLLHVLVLAGLRVATGLPSPTLALLVGLLASAGVVVLAVVAAERIRPGSGLAAAIVVATSTQLTYWAFGGLETVLAGAVLLAMLIAWAGWWTSPRRTSQNVVAVSATMAAVLVRPEFAPIALATALGAAAALWVADLGGGHAVRWRPGARRGGALIGMVVSCAAAVVLFRVVYFGAPVAQPVATKAGVAPGRGLDYVLSRLAQTPLLGLILLAALVVGAWRLWRRPQPQPTLAIITAGMLAVVAATITSGGDWMPGARMLVPAVAPAGVVLVTGIGSSWRPAAAGGLALLGIASSVLFAANASVGAPAWERWRLRDAAEALVEDPRSGSEPVSRITVRDLPAADALEALVAELGSPERPVVMASHQAGFLVARTMREHAGEVVWIDLANLTADPFDDCTALLEPTRFGRVMPWEPWFANLDRCGHPRPDIVFDLGRIEQLGEAADGYVTVYRSKGAITLPGTRLGGVMLRGAQYIAVRHELVGTLESDLYRRIDFEEVLN